MQTVLVILAIPFGLFAGGFATMLADRMLDDSPLSLRSRCPNCETRLSFADTVPVLSWFRLGGTCRNCGGSITVGYPIAEAATAALFVWIAFRYDQTDWLIVVPLILAVAGVALAATDLYTYRLPNRIVFPAFWISLIAMAVLAVVELDRPSAVLGALAAGVGYFLFLFAFNLAYPPAMGFGDVKLALLLGLHTGWIGSAFYDDTSTVFRLTFWALLVGMFAYLAFSLVVTGLRRFVDADILPDPLDDGAETTPLRRKAIPLGPGLIVGALFVVLYPGAVLG